MKKQLLVLLLALLITFISVRESFAVLPLLLFGEIIDVAVDTFVIRSVGRAVVQTVGTAANDSSWTTAFMNWLNASRAIGTLIINQNHNAAGVPEIVEVQLAAPISDLTKGALSLKYYGAWPYQINAALSNDGLAHNIPNLTTSADPDPTTAANILIAWINSVSSPAWQYAPASNCRAGTNYAIQCDSSCLDVNTCSSLAVALNSINVENKDGIKRIKKVGNSWSADSTDPDWLPSEISNINASTALRFYGTANGNVANLDIYAKANDYGIQYQEQVSPAVLRELAILTGPDFVPAAIDSAQGPGVVSPNPDGSTASGSSPASIQFPNDYARVGEAAAAANAITPKLDILHHDLSDTANAADPLEVDPTTMPSFGTTFDNLKAWNLPAHASTCPAPDIDLSGVFGAGHVYHFNAHCQLIQDHFAALQAAMMVAWSLMAMFVVLRA